MEQDVFEKQNYHNLLQLISPEQNNTKHINLWPKLRACVFIPVIDLMMGGNKNPYILFLYILSILSRVFNFWAYIWPMQKKKKKIEIVYLHWTNTSFDLLLYVHFGLSNNLFTPIILKSFVCIFKWEYPPPPEKGSIVMVQLVYVLSLQYLDSLTIWK